MVNGVAHGPLPGTTLCQLHMRHFKDGDELYLEPWRAKAFPVVKDLVVDRSAFDRLVAAGGFISVSTGSAPGAFDSYDDYVQNNVYGLPALNSIPLRVDCGTFDRFYFATRQFVGQLKKPPAGSFSLGGHDEVYWRTQLPGELAWMS